VVIQERELVRDEPANKVGADVDLIGMHPHPLLLTVAALGGDQDRTGNRGIETGFTGYEVARNHHGRSPAPYQPDRKLRERTLAAIATLTTQGHAVGYCAIGALQDPRKDVNNLAAGSSALWTAFR
jgi:hypothetical protein